jgi:hypothetical protein
MSENPRLFNMRRVNAATDFITAELMNLLDRNNYDSP